jgi:dihydrofolate reductase
MEENPELVPDTIITGQSNEPMEVSIIVAMGKNREIGKDNNLMWHLSEDMRFFKQTTLRHYVIMGRKNFDSIPAKYKPLPDRVNIILSRNADFMYEECYTCATLDEAIELGRENGEERVFIIGGGQIYKLALDANLVTEMFITHVDAAFPDADIFFPEINENLWDKEHMQSGIADSQNEFNFEIYRYRRKKITG